MADEEKTLRDEFAMNAAQGCMAAFKHWPSNDDIKRVAQISYNLADAMLKERSNKVSE